MVKCKSLRINMLRITHTGKSVNFPVTMLIEGVYLYLFVVNVYNISDKMKVSHEFSWGNYEIKNPFSL